MGKDCTFIKKAPKWLNDGHNVDVCNTMYRPVARFFHGWGREGGVYTCTQRTRTKFTINIGPICHACKCQRHMVFMGVRLHASPERF